ncbi:transferrin-binding protein-like solute binding protein [Sedimentitalea todarodis]|uniref:Thymidylate synthase n=1 Tax=Sedimentitalea todarodis TaxID=1631240 RepID=A0ABU3VF39_9RHOB|nr:transferrin-binding protein-like solute binding protein [Sedimentitalea todarodis]MDU9004797.1 thymidylate synthase [Sedimentitalea todarodis]
MKRFVFGVALATALSACSGGNPFLEDDGGGGTDPVDPTSPIPEAVSSDLDAAAYTPDPTNPRLVVTGVAFNGTPLPVEYVREASLDSPGGEYQAFERQPDALNTHTTAYARSVTGAQGVLVVSGGLDGFYNGGATYSANGFAVPAPNTANADVRYDGEYVGLMNLPDNGDALLPVPPGTDPAVVPRQAARVFGDARIDADFSAMRVKGQIYNRTYAAQGTALETLQIAPAEIQADGSFAGDVTQDQQPTGDYGGAFGGPNANSVAGALFASDHVAGVSGVEEFGLFVLERSN